MFSKHLDKCHLTGCFCLFTVVVYSEIFVKKLFWKLNRKPHNFFLKRSIIKLLHYIIKIRRRNLKDIGILIRISPKPTPLYHTRITHFRKIIIIYSQNLSLNYYLFHYFSVLFFTKCRITLLFLYISRICRFVYTYLWYNDVNSQKKKITLDTRYNIYNIYV